MGRIRFRMRGVGHKRGAQQAEAPSTSQPPRAKEVPMVRTPFDTLTRELATDTSRRRVLGGLLGAVTALAGGHLAEARRRGKHKGKPKVTLCHNGQTIKVGKAAVASHLAQGDYLGPCRQTCPPGTC